MKNNGLTEYRSDGLTERGKDSQEKTTPETGVAGGNSEQAAPFSDNETGKERIETPVVVSSAEIESRKKSLIEAILEAIKNLIAKFLKYPQFSVFAQKFQDLESRLEESVFYNQVTMDELEEMKLMLKRCKEYADDTSLEMTRIKEDLCEFVSNETSFTAIDFDGMTYYILCNPDAQFLFDEGNDKFFSEEKWADTFVNLREESLRVYVLSPDKGFEDITMKIDTPEELETVKLAIESGTDISGNIPRNFDSLDKSGKLRFADEIVSGACNKCLEQVREYERAVNEKLVESYEQILYTPSNEIKHDEPELER